MTKTACLLAAIGLIALTTACSKPADTDTAEEAATVEATMDPERAEQIGLGETIATNVCAQCHAVTRTGLSPHADAKPFRELSWAYPIEALAEPLTEGIMVGHPDMPEFQFEVEQVDAILAYIESVQVPKPD